MAGCQDFIVVGPDQEIGRFGETIDGVEYFPFGNVQLLGHFQNIDARLLMGSIGCHCLGLVYDSKGPKCKKRDFEELRKWKMKNYSGHHGRKQ